METEAKDFADYANTIVNFNQFCIDKSYNGDLSNLYLRVTDILQALLEHWSTGNNTRHDWTNAKPENCGDVIFIHASNTVTRIGLQILINKEGIFLEMEIAAPHNMPCMPDDFWQQWFGLSNYGKFELLENETFFDEEGKKYPDLFPFTPGNMLVLMRNMVAFPLLYEKNIDWGNLSVGWLFDQYSIAEVFEKGAFAFQQLCSLNTRLMDVK